MNAVEELTVMCAWHPKYWGKQLVMREGPKDAPVSHGICQKCKEIAIRELAK